MNKTLNLEYKNLKNKSLLFLNWDQGWDGYSAEKVNEAELSLMFLLLDKCLKRELPIPRLIPVSSGELEITWKNKNKEALIIHDKEGYHFFCMEDNKFIYIEENVNLPEVNEEFCKIVKRDFCLEYLNFKIERLLRLKEVKDNWDNKGSLAMKEDTFCNTLSFIKCKLNLEYGIFLNEKGEVLIDVINPTSVKGLTIEINSKEWRIYINDEFIFSSEDIFLLCCKINTLIKK